MKNAPATARAIEAAWSEELAKHFGVQVSAVTENIRPWFDFPGNVVRIELMDGSSLEIKRAIPLISESRRAIAVFSEHCGNFVVPYHEARIYVDGQLTYDQNAV